MDSVRADSKRLIILLVFLAMSRTSLAAHTEREVSTPLPGHPGNVFLVGEEIRLPAPRGTATWQAANDSGKVVAGGTLPPEGKDALLGRPGVGWYRVRFDDRAGNEIESTTAAVIHKLKTSTPGSSPICVDSATSWFSRNYPGEEVSTQEAYASLAALAGVNWIRDRMSWREMEPEQGHFLANSVYDRAAEAQARHGLKVLDVFHDSPDWATDKTLDGAGQRFSRDLRHHFRFCRTMARRFRGRIQAWEPWNEANIEVFGGHTIDEMCSLQKASYLGLKAGDDAITVGWNVYAGSGSNLHTQGVQLNEAWPYFETYNIHSYRAPDQYLDLFETARRGACGRPIWLTECGIRLSTTDESAWGDLSAADELSQAQFIARSFASSLYAGTARHFFFILGNYNERGTQFGLLRHDLTPRPGYVALAAAGRFLANAECLGRVSSSIYVFRSRPDGKPHDLLVAWQGPVHTELPDDLKLDALYDYLGRPVRRPALDTIGPAPLFALLPPGESEKLALERPPAVSPRRDGSPSPVVLQVSLPVQTIRLDNQAHQVEPGAESALPLFAYNFSQTPVTGSIEIENAPAQWNAQLSVKRLDLRPMERKNVTLRIHTRASGRDLMTGEWIRLRGHFGEAGSPVLAFRLAADLARLTPSQVKHVATGNSSTHWQDNIVPKAVMSHRAAQPTGVLFDMRFTDTDPWAYPRLKLAERDVPPDDFDGLAVTLQILKGSGAVRVQFVESSGASYIAETGADASNRELQRCVVLFRHAKWAAHSHADPDRHLRPSDIQTIMVGVNSERDSEFTMRLHRLEWIKF